MMFSDSQWVNCIQELKRRIESGIITTLNLYGIRVMSPEYIHVMDGKIAMTYSLDKKLHSLGRNILGWLFQIVSQELPEQPQDANHPYDPRG